MFCCFYSLPGPQKERMPVCESTRRASGGVTRVRDEHWRRPGISMTLSAQTVAGTRTTHRLWAAYELAIRIGPRRGELLGLRWSDVDLQEGVLTVRQALQRVGGELLIVAPKTQRSARRVALPSECVTALRAQRPHRSRTERPRAPTGRERVRAESSPPRTGPPSSPAT